MTKQLSLSLNASQALRIIGLVVAIFFMPTERWTSLPISDALAADGQLARSAGWDSLFESCIETIKSAEALYPPRGPIPEPSPLAIGCKLADCGPGTDGPGPINLRITLTGELAESAILKFENMTVRDATRIAVRGNARHVKGTTRFEIHIGTTVLRGFANNPNLLPPVAIPHLTLNRNALKALKQAAKVDDLIASNKSPVTLNIEQFRGPVIVNEYAVRDSFRFCPSPLRPTLNPTKVPLDLTELLREPGPGRPRLDPTKVPPKLTKPILESREFDFVDFVTPPQGTVTILAPGRRWSSFLGGCKNYHEEVYHNVLLENHLSDEEALLALAALHHGLVDTVQLRRRCHSEVVVYSEAHALAVVQPVIPPWTDAPGDRVPITLPPRLTVPVTAWIIYDSTNSEFDTPTKVVAYVANVTSVLRTDLASATDAFTYNPMVTPHTPMCGIQFPNLTIHTIDMGKLLIDDTPNILNILNGRTKDDFTEVDAGDAEKRYINDISPKLYDPTHLNLYLLWGQMNPDITVPAHSLPTAGSIACQNTDWGFNCDVYGDMILLSSTDRDPLTVAHEIGHTLSLEHTGFVNTNLMGPSTSSSGPYVTQGQCYRAHVDYTSYLNTDGIRTGPQLKDCPRDSPYTSPVMCPDLTFDGP